MNSEPYHLGSIRFAEITLKEKSQFLNLKWKHPYRKKARQHDKVWSIITRTSRFDTCQVFECNQPLVPMSLFVDHQGRRHRHCTPIALLNAIGNNGPQFDQFYISITGINQIEFELDSFVILILQKGNELYSF